MNPPSPPPSFRDTANTPSRLFLNIRRSLTPSSSKPYRDIDGHDPHVPYTQSRFLRDSETARPTVEEIAMGLHLSRTPHLPAHLAHLHVDPPAPSSSHHVSRMQRRHSYSQPRSRSRYHVTPRHPPPLPPPPSRSALKKASVSSPKSSVNTLDSAASGSTAPSSSTPPTPTGYAYATFFRLRQFGKSIAGTKIVGLSASPASGSEVSVATSEPLRKAVRFEEVLP
ncbi:hypothetical protein OF83DRAFT_1174219 [Amylostereum chailletii]|nr:hypothetical protein OF83DRAFT_1174219 [Amylostereum chailletii]